MEGRKRHILTPCRLSNVRIAGCPRRARWARIYCPQCGWNREAAEKQTRLLLRVLPVLVIVFDAPLIVYIFIGHAELPVLAALGVLAIVPGILVVLA